MGTYSIFNDTNLIFSAEYFIIMISSGRNLINFICIPGTVTAIYFFPYSIVAIELSLYYNTW